jgi:putative Mg2+ transporter-C (MgtC) family protein
MFEPLELQMMLRLILSCVLGAAIGLERERGDRPAGFRTHALVCMGSCLFMLVSLYGFDGLGTARDPARLAAQVVAGVGFLGAGTIMHEGVNVKGLTTAASIWMVSAIGLAVGVGMYSLSMFATLLVLGALIILGRWGKAVNFAKRSERYTIKISAKDQPGNLERIMAHLKITGVKVKSVNVMRDLVSETITINTSILVSEERIEYFNGVLMDIKRLGYVTAVEDVAQIK